MKTTVELPDDLLVAAKIRAVETRSTLRELIEQGLRRVLDEQPHPPGRKDGRIEPGLRRDRPRPTGRNLLDRFFHAPLRNFPTCR